MSAVLQQALLMVKERGLAWRQITTVGSSNVCGTGMSTDGSIIYGCAYIDYVYETTNTGISWVRDSNSGLKTWTCMTSSPDGTYLVAGDSGPGYINLSADGGTTWSFTTGVPLTTWASVATSDNGSVVYAISSNESNIFYSTNGGSSWSSKTTFETLGTGKDVACSSDGSKAYVATGGFYISTDSGNNWTRQTFSGSAVACSSDGVKVARCAASGYIWTSTNSGNTWTQQTNSGSRNWLSIASSSDGNTLIASSGNVYLSTDSGSTWTQQTMVGGATLNKVDISPDGNIRIAMNDYTGAGTNIQIYS